MCTQSDSPGAVMVSRISANPCRELPRCNRHLTAAPAVCLWLLEPLASYVSRFFFCHSCGVALSSTCISGSHGGFSPRHSHFDPARTTSGQSDDPERRRSDPLFYCKQ